MSKQQFKSQADICKKSLDILHKAIESNAIIKAFDVVEPPKSVAPKAKTEDAAKEEKPKRTRKTKTAKEPAPVDSKPTIDEMQPTAEPSVEENSNIFSMFDD